MAKFASAAKQATSVIKEMQGDSLQSVGTVRNYEQALKAVAEYAKDERIQGGLRGMTPEQAVDYLHVRGEQVGQKTLDMERQAIQAMMRHVTGKLEQGERLDVVQSDRQQVLESRSYTPEQVDLIANAQNERNGLATEIAHAAGLRAHELLTLQRANERAPSDRPALDSKFEGRTETSTTYTVHGKGGLVREVVLPKHLAERLEDRRLAEAVKVTDRGVHYQTRYDIAGGKNWSNSFSAASERALGFSNGAHGLRHSYAQERMAELASRGYDRNAALETVSQELGHFRSEITEVYLR